MPFARKVHWIVGMNKESDERSFAQHVDAAGIDTVCIRTTTPRLPGAIKTFHKMKKTVWAWRWPGVDDDPAKAKGPHYFAPLEAEFVAKQCIPAGLDGYIVDPESDDDKGVNDWNQVEVKGRKLKDLAKDFWAVIKKAAKGKKFHCGITSGWDFPDPNQKPILPWGEFIGPSDAVYPQTYWRIDLGQGKLLKRFGGDPAVGCNKRLPIWKKVSMGKPIIPMAGEIDVVTAKEITAYGKAMATLKLDELHFYADLPKVKPEVLAAIKAL
jgi:hypothetical protein